MIPKDLAVELAIIFAGLLIFVTSPLLLIIREVFRRRSKRLKAELDIKIGEKK